MKNIGGPPARLYILVAGMPGSGKSLVADVARQMNIPVYTMGDIVREETLKRFGDITPRLMVETSKILRIEGGKSIIALRTLQKIRDSCNVVLIDGIRSLEEVEVFRTNGEIAIIAVHASPKTRFKRLQMRGRPGDPSTYEEFTYRDQVELNYGLGNVIALADYMIVNEGNLESARELARSILLGLVRQYGGDHC